MKKSILVALLVAAFAVPAMAQTAAPAAPEAAPASPPPLTANIGLFSSYRFRGIDQTFGKPALQGGVDYAHSSGFYVGNWNSNVSSGAGYPDGNLESDFYGGYKHAFGDFGIDVGLYYYYYWGSEGKVLGTHASSGAVDNKEIYFGASWKFLSAKYSYSLDDYFSARGVDSTGTSTGKNTRGSSYFEVNANYDLGDGWGVNGHVGTLDFKNVHNGDYTDWKIGATKDFSGWVVGLAYVDTNAKGSCKKNVAPVTSFQPYCFANSASDNNGTLSTGSHTKDAGRGIAVLSVSRTF